MRRKNIQSSNNVSKAHYCHR